MLFGTDVRGEYFRLFSIRIRTSLMRVNRKKKNEKINEMKTLNWIFGQHVLNKTNRAND